MGVQWNSKCGYKSHVGHDSARTSSFHLPYGRYNWAGRPEMNRDRPKGTGFGGRVDGAGRLPAPGWRQSRLCGGSGGFSQSALPRFSTAAARGAVEHEMPQDTRCPYPIWLKRAEPDRFVQEALRPLQGQLGKLGINLVQALQPFEQQVSREAARAFILEPCHELDDPAACSMGEITLRIFPCGPRISCKFNNLPGQCQKSADTPDPISRTNTENLRTDSLVWEGGVNGVDQCGTQAELPLLWRNGSSRNVVPERQLDTACSATIKLAGGKNNCRCVSSEGGHVQRELVPPR